MCLGDAIADGVMRQHIPETITIRRPFSVRAANIDH